MSNHMPGPARSLCNNSPAMGIQPILGMDLKSRINKHFTDSAHLKLQAMELLAEPLARASEQMARCLMNEGKILSCGNGGSASLHPVNWKCLSSRAGGGEPAPRV